MEGLFKSFYMLFLEVLVIFPLKRGRKIGVGQSQLQERIFKR